MLQPTKSIAMLLGLGLLVGLIARWLSRIWRPPVGEGG